MTRLSRIATRNTAIERYPQNSVCPRGVQPAGKPVSAASAVPPAEANAPNQRNESVISAQRRMPKPRPSRMKPWKMLSPVTSV